MEIPHIVCDCGASRDGPWEEMTGWLAETYGESGAVEAIKGEAEIFGWRQINGAWVCPGCAGTTAQAELSQRRHEADMTDDGSDFEVEIMDD